MRTERLWTVLLATAIAVPLGVTAPAAAQTEAPPAPPAPEAPSGSAVITGDHTIAAGSTVEGAVVVGGDLTVEGEITGDAVVVGGDLILEGSGFVRGNAVVTGGEIVRNGGRVAGEMRVVDGDIGGLGAAIGLPAGAAQEVERAARHEHAGWDRRGEGFFGSIQRGIAGIVGTLAFGLVLAGAGALMIFYGRRYLDNVSDTIRTSTLRSAGVGMAALFLIVPAFVVLVVALAVSIIGIPFLLVAVPLYPLAIAAAMAFGLLAAAHALGERTAEQRQDVYDLRYRNAYAYLFTGLGMLLTPLLAADLIAMTGFLGFIGGLLKVVTSVAILIATTIGFGAVILSRLGTQRGFIRPETPEPPLDMDPLFDDEPAQRGTDV